MLYILLHLATAVIYTLSHPTLVSGAPHQPRRSEVSRSFASLPKPILAPYYLYFGNSATASLADAYDQIGLRAATIGFITAVPGKCTPTSDLDTLEGDIAKYVAKGGAINLSFGGAIGASSTHAHIQSACEDVHQLAALITAQLKRFNTHNAEFDIEDPGLLADNAATQRLAAALAIVQKNIPELHLTYTLATLPTGLPQAQLAQVQAAKDAGVTIDILALMTMDMVPNNVEASSEAAVLAGAKQLEKVYGLRAGSGLKRMGVIPMIGKDDLGAHFSVSDAGKLASFVDNNKIAYMTFWNLNRDFSGSNPLTNSGARDQREPYQFFSTMKAKLSTNGAPVPGAGSDTSSLGVPNTTSTSVKPSPTASIALLPSSLSTETGSPPIPTVTTKPSEAWVTVTVTVTSSTTSPAPEPTTRHGQA